MITLPGKGFSLWTVLLLPNGSKIRNAVAYEAVPPAVVGVILDEHYRAAAWWAHFTKSGSVVVHLGTRPIVCGVMERRNS